MTQKKLKQFILMCDDVECNECPVPKDWRKEDHPYKARYGDEMWEDEIKKSKTFKGSMFVTDLVTHIVETSRNKHG